MQVYLPEGLPRGPNRLGFLMVLPLGDGWEENTFL